MNNKPQTFIFYGIVGSGKGTQVELLTKYLNDNHISDDVLFVSPGAEYRKILSEESFISNTVKKWVNNGILVPDFFTTSLVVNSLSKNVKENSTIITDGYPRTIKQSESFMELMNFYGRDSVKIIYINIGKEEAIKRMKLRARTDDTDEGIANRFDEYEKNVLPSMNYFRDKEGYMILNINGDQSKEEVHNEIINKLKPYL